MKKRIVYYPIYHKEGEPGAERSADVLNWIENFMIPAGIATLKEEKANAYLVATGDGGLMRIARNKCDEGKIILGVNRGNVGFLLNQIMEINKIPLFLNEIDLIELNLIKVCFVLKNGKELEYLAFNDVFCGGDIADYIKFEIEGSLSGFQNRIVFGNGIVIATPQGSSAFALNARGSSAVLPLDTKAWFVCGVATGPYPDDIVSPQRIIVSVEARTPVNGYADGKEQVAKDIKQMIIMPTDKKVTLGFLKGQDFNALRREKARKLERGEC